MGTSSVGFELLEALAAENAPPSGAVLWDFKGKTKMVRHGGEPLTTEFVCGVILDKEMEVTKAVTMPKGIRAVVDTKRHKTSLDKDFTKAEYNKALLDAMRSDCVDSKRRATKKKKPKNKTPLPEVKGRLILQDGEDKHGGDSTES